MSDLISRKALLEFFDPDNKEMPWAIAVRSRIIQQPTAYDPDKVVEKLEDLQNFEERTGKSYCPEGAAECRYKYSDLGCTHCAFEKAIEIVKGGGKCQRE